MLLYVLAVLLATADALSQPIYQEPQYVPVQGLPPQYRQYYLAQQAPTATPVHEPQPELEQQGLQQGPQQFAHQTAQPLLRPIDKQIQKAAYHVAGPQYSSQVQNVQLQEQSLQAQAQLQRNALRIATAPRAQPIQYQRAQPQPQPIQYERQPSAPRYVAQQPALPDQQQIAEQYDTNPSYQFGFDVKDDTFTNYQNRKEQREGDKITGSYSVVDSDGFIRTVTYTADAKNGFKAEVSRQPTDIVVKVPTPQPPVQSQQQQIIRQPQPQYYESPVEQAPEQGAAAQPQDQPQKHRIVYQYQ